MKPLRLALVSRRFWPNVGPSDRALSNLATELRRQGARPVVVTARWDKSWPSKVVHREVPVVRLPYGGGGGWSTIGYLRRLSSWLRRHRDEFDLVCVDTLRHEAYAAVRALRRGGPPVVLRCQRVGGSGDCLWQKNSRRGAKIRHWCRQAAGVVAASRLAQSELRSADYPAQRIHYIADGVEHAEPRDPQRRIAARSALADAHQVLAVAEHSPLVLYDGPLRPDRRLDDLIAAWPPIAARWPNARLWLVGRGRHATELWETIKRRDLAHQVILTGSFDHLDEVLQAADLLVLPAGHEGRSLSLLEAMACGLGIVAADVEENRELIVDGRDGLLTPPGDVGRLAEAMLRLLETPRLAAALGDAARCRAAEQFSLSRMAAEYLRLFEQLAATPRRDCP